MMRRRQFIGLFHAEFVDFSMDKATTCSHKNSMQKTRQRLIKLAKIDWKEQVLWSEVYIYIMYPRYQCYNAFRNDHLSRKIYNLSKQNTDNIVHSTRISVMNVEMQMMPDFILIQVTDISSLQICHLLMHGNVLDAMFAS